MTEPLSPRERALIQKFSENPIDFFSGEMRGWLEDFLLTSNVGGSGSGGGSAAVTGDYKMSAQTATHTDSSGTWYLCNGDAIPAAEADLINLVGANTPDARGRALVMLGTHADVNLVGDNEGIGTVANRRHKHGHSRTGAATLSGSNSNLSLTGSNSNLAISGSNSSIGLSGDNSSISGGSAPSGATLLATFNTTGAGTAWSGGSNQGMVGGSNSSLSLSGSNSSIGLSGSNSSLAMSGSNSSLSLTENIVIGPDTNDQGAYIVPGNLFIHS